MRRKSGSGYFPPDLYELLKRQRIPGGYDWVRDHDAILYALAQPLNGLLFDVEQNELWFAEWGKRPVTSRDREAVLREIVQCAPRLIPLYGHRYLPERPHARGNPVLSVMQSDIIIYGGDLRDWMNAEFGHPGATEDTYSPHEIREIEFWSKFLW